MEISKISKKDYEFALDIIKNYKLQNKIKSNKKNRVDNRINIIIDDTFKCIDINEKTIYSECASEFQEILQILLTEKQYENFCRNDTSRKFKITQNKIDKMNEYIKTSIWRNKI